MMKNLVFKIIFCAFVFSTMQACSFAEDEITLDMPDFSNLKKNVRELGEKTKKGAKVFGQKSIETFDKAKEGVNNAVLKTGKPTDGGLSDLSKKQKQEQLSKYQNKGYYGILPDINKEFDYIKQVSKKTNLQNQYKDTLIDEMSLKKAPQDDELFLDIILKKGKETKYNTDVLKMLPLLERFRTCISERCDIQKFNANVNLVDLYTRKLEQDYAQTPDSQSESYYLIRNISYLAKLQGNLKYEANFYSKYMPLTGTIYSKENIDKKDNELLIELDKTIFALRQLK